MSPGSSDVLGILGSGALEALAVERRRCRRELQQLLQAGVRRRDLDVVFTGTMLFDVETRSAS